MRQALPPVLVPGRDPEPRRAGDARVDPRGRRARLRAGPRLRGRVRQPRPGGVLRRGRRRGRDRPAGRELALQQVPRPGRATGPCCRSCTSTATRSPTRPSWPASPRTSSRRCCEGYGHRPIARRGRRPGGRCTALMAAALDEARRRRSRAIQRDARSGGRARAAGVADDRAAHPEGLDRPGGGRRGADRGHVPLPPGAADAASPTAPTTSRMLEAWMRSYRPEELFDDDRRARRASCSSWRPAATRRMSANPHANGGAAAAAPDDARLPRATPSRSPRPGRPIAEATRVLGGLPARRHAAQRGPAQLPPLRARRDRLQPARPRCSR